MNFIIIDFYCRIQPDRVVKMIGACAILHNIALSKNVPLPGETIEDEQNENYEEIINGTMAIFILMLLSARYFNLNYDCLIIYYII